ncbi:hypothetical protein ABKN59_011490 [Abortiporus biennis]
MPQELPQVSTDSEELQTRIDQATTRLILSLLPSLSYTSLVSLSNSELASIFCCAVNEVHSFNGLKEFAKEWKIGANDITNVYTRESKFERAVTVTNGLDEEDDEEGSYGCLRRALEEAWRIKKFGIIRNAEFLRHPYNDPSPSRTETREMKSSGFEPRGTLESWELPFQSEHHKFLYQTIQHHCQTAARRHSTESSHFHYRSQFPRHNLNTLCIVQSPGTGKSRLVDELGKLVFTVPFCLRHGNARPGYKYPHSDHSISRHLTDIVAWHLSRTEMEVRIYFHIFFGSIFKVIHEDLDKLVVKLAKQKLARHWKIRLDGENGVARDRFCAKIMRCVETYEKPSVFDHEAEEEALSYALSALKSLSARLKDVSIQPSINGQGQSSSSSIHDRSPEFVIFLDKAEVLVPKSESEDDHFPSLISCFNKYIDEFSGDDSVPVPVFGIFASDSPRLYRSAYSVRRPLRQRGESQMRYDGQEWDDPFMILPFDCSPEFPLSGYNYTRKDIGSIGFAVKFGRPLYWTLWKSISNISRADHELIEMIQTRLVDSVYHFSVSYSPTEKFYDSYYSRRTGGVLLHPLDYDTQRRQQENMKSEGRKNLAGLAVVDVRLNLDYVKEGSRVNYSQNRYRRVQEELVEYHMRLIHFVSKWKGIFSSGYSSEPILAEAAAWQLYRWRGTSTYRTVIFDILQYFTPSADSDYHAILDRTKIEKMVGRGMITEAHDRAIEMRYPLKTFRSPKMRYQKGCKVGEWLNELFQSRLEERIRKSRPDQIQEDFDPHQTMEGFWSSESSHSSSPSSTSKTITLNFEEAFKNAWINFTHFERIEDEDEYSNVLNVHGINRRGADVVIPVFFDDPTTTTPIAEGRNGQNSSHGGIGTGEYDDEEEEEGVPVCPKHMSAICVKFRYVKKDSFASIYRPIGMDLENDYDFFNDDEDVGDIGFQKLPYIVMTLDLGEMRRRRKKEEKLDKIHTDGTSSTDTSTCDLNPTTFIPIEDFKISPNRRHHPRYAIQVLGCTETNYKIFLENAPSDISQCRRLLGLYEFESGVVDRDGYGWINNPFLNRPEDFGDLKEDFEVDDRAWVSGEEWPWVDRE